MRKLFCLLYFIAPLLGSAQTGHYFLSHHAPEDDRLHHGSFDIAQATNGVMYFATRSGLISFDGSTWENVSDHAAVYAVESADDGSLYWAGANGYGLLVRDDTGKPWIKALSDDGTRDVFQIALTKDGAYFMTGDSIFCHAVTRDEVSATPLPTGASSFTSLFTMYGMVYASTDAGTVFRLEEKRMIPAKWSQHQNVEVIFAYRHESNYLIGDADSRLFLCNDDLVLREINIREKDLLRASVIVDAAWISSELVMVGTLRGGLLCLNPETGRIVERIDYRTGLPDNEVFSLMSDSNRNVWVSHEYGVTQVSPFLPFRSYHHYEGLAGNILCAKTFRNEVFVGTSLGLFRLVKEDQYDEMVYFEPREAGSANDGEMKPKRGLFGFLKRNRDKKPATASAGKIADNAEGVRKTKKIFRASTFRYEKINGLEAKVTSIEAHDGDLIASGLSGVYEIRSDAAVIIVEEPIRRSFVRAGMLIASTTSDDLLISRKASDKWTTRRLKLDDQITSVAVDDARATWLFGLEAAYRLTVEDGEPLISERIEYPESTYASSIGISIENKLLVGTGAGFFQIDASSQHVERVDSLGNAGLLFGHPDGIWFHDGHLWRLIGSDNAGNVRPLLGLCRDIRFIGPPDENGNVWIVNHNDELYNFSISAVPPVENPFPVYLKTVVQGDRQLPLSRIRAAQEKGALVFELSQPGHVAGMDTEYRYRVKGLDDRWSEWSRRHSRISFPFLPHGTYDLSVQSRDVFGDVQELGDIQFRVELPYWKTPWFYAMELTMFVLLIWLSFKLSYKYRIISRLLSLLTIILLIEFIQTIAGYSFSSDSSPILEFLIQVAVAFVILPVEGYLRNLWFRSTGANSRLYHVIS